MAPTANVQERANGIAFEVDFKNPKAANVMTPCRARLEGYAANSKSLPRLLSINRETPEKAMAADKAAEKARSHNEKLLAAAAKAKEEKSKRIDDLRKSLEEDMGKAQEKRRTSLADTATKAGEHFDKVKSKLTEVQRQQADASAGLQRRLQDTLAQKGAAHDAGIAERGEKAGKHNEQVAERLAQHQKNQASTSAEQQRRLDEDLAQKGAAHDAGVAERGGKAGKHNEQVVERVKKAQEEQQERTEKLREKLGKKGLAGTPPPSPSGAKEGKGAAPGGDAPAADSVSSAFVALASIFSCCGGRR